MRYAVMRERAKTRTEGTKVGEELHRVSAAAGWVEFRLKWTARRTVGITVRPDMNVVVTAPRGIELEAVKALLRRRARWIRRQQDYFSRFQPTVPPRRYVSGETHRYLGRQYRLKVVEGPQEGVKLVGKFIRVETEGKTGGGRVRRLVATWFVVHARKRFERSLAGCLKRFHGRVSCPELRLRRMRKRWGSWTRRGVVYLNPELVQAPPSCIDYVVTHELCHLLHAAHGRAFYDLLRRVMPDWERRKDHLEQVAAETGLGTVDGCYVLR
ncbi:MAG: M48 family peptidase [Verrucomicrobia bacterium]|nr:MAG: M48 family peptidase [Verrucomicrobiota bacterium]